MRKYRKTFNVGETFPVELGQTWVVREGKRVAEKWEVIRVRREQYTVEVTEYFRTDNGE